MAAADIKNLGKARAELQGVSARRLANRTQLQAARATLGELVRKGAPATKRRSAQRKIAQLERRDAELLGKEAQIRARVGDLRDRIRLRQPEDSVKQLAGGLPACLLPVRLETRFGEGDKLLRIRIFPEQLHIDSHEPELTEEEQAAGRGYWSKRWTAADDSEVRGAAWRTLAKAARPTRARWIVQATTPTNVDQLGAGEPLFPDAALRPGPWTRAPLARLLPEQWVALGYLEGKEVFRVWSAPVDEEIAVGLAPDLDAADELATPADIQDELPIDEGMRWMSDYDEAVRVGMAVTVTRDDVPGSRPLRLSELVVLGVDWSLDPKTAAAGLGEQLDRHAVSDGLALLGPGTPTNNTSDQRAGPDTDPLLDVDAHDPARATHQDAGVRLARALGASASTGLTSAPGTGGLDDQVAADMQTVLWAPTFGYFFDQIARPLIASNRAEQILDHARRYVRGAGPFPALRVGRQPYGVLPVLSGSLVAEDEFRRELAARLEGLRFIWNSAALGPPRLGDSARPDADLVELLRRTPRAEAFRFREASKPTYWSSIFGFELAAEFQELAASILLSLAGISGNTELTSVVASPSHRAVPVPLVSFGELSETEPLDPNYIASVLSQTSVAGGFRRLLADPSEASTLLQALLRHAAGLEIANGTTQLVIEHELKAQILTREPRVKAVFDREVHGIELRPTDGAIDDDAPESLLNRVSGVVELAETNVRAVSGTQTLADHLLTSKNGVLIGRVPTRRFAEFRSALGRLVNVPTAELKRRSADVLDCASHRLDAWLTSVATRQLDEIRANESGCHIGAFGYVEDLAPSARTPSQGYLHGPSIAHATTAAILRSGHLARRDAADGLLAIDLSSRRVERALELIDGVRSGQPIGALLGYRFERGLRDRRLTLARYILPIRQLAPLASSSTGPPDGDPVEAIAAREVVDGLRLLERWKADSPGLFAAAGVAAADRADVDSVLREIDDLFDAVSDLLVAESVHQAVLGNAERSAAALDALDRQESIPELGFVRTPRTVTGYQHRLLILADSAAPATGWESLDDARRAAEPRLDNWVGTVIGTPDRVRFGGTVLDSEGATIEAVEAGLGDLGLSALSTALASVGAGDAPSELEQRLALHLGGLVSAADAAQLVLLQDPPAGSPASAIGLRQLLDLGAEINDLLASARMADARTLASEVERPDAGLDVTELKGRADGAVAALQSARSDLAGISGASPAADIATKLLALADAGQRLAIAGDAGGSGLAALVSDALRSADDVLNKVTALESAFDRAAATDTAAVAHDLNRLRTIFGEAFPAVPVFTITNTAELATSASDGALLGSEPLAAATWLTRHALVRPAAARLVGVLEASEMLGGRARLDDLTVTQLPHQPGDRWIGLPWPDDGARPSANLSMVVHGAAGVDFSAQLAGLIVDQWSDVVPSTHETTGLSFHFDAPGARAPQSILVAVPGDTATPSWTVEALAAAVRDAMALARTRSYDIDDLAAAARFLPATYLPFNIERKTPGLNLAAVIAQAVELQNAEFQRRLP